MRTAARIVPWVLLTSVAACDSGPEESADRWALAGVEPTQVVVNTTPGWEAGQGWRVEESLAVGADATDALQFGEIVGVDTDGLGIMYVADKLAQQVWVIGPDGALIRTIGNPGQGPGELGANIGGVFLVGDDVVVPDVANQRVSRFGTDGTFRDSFRVSADRGVPMRWDVSADGRLVAQRRVVAPEGDAVSPDVVVTVNDAGAVPDTLRQLPLGQSVQITGGIPVVRPFAPEPVWDSTAEGRFVTAMTNARTLEMRGAGGAVEWVATLPGEAGTATRLDRETVEASLRGLYEREATPPAIVEQVVDRMEFDDRLPSFADVVIGPGGSVWVREVRSPLADVGVRALVSARDMGGREWTVLDPDGRLMGTVTFPLDFRPLQAVGDTFYGVGTDDFGTESVRAFRVVTQ